MDRRPSYANLNGTSTEGVRPPNMSAHGLGNYQPDGPQTIHRSDLYFMHPTPHMNTRKNSEFSPSNTTSASISSQLYPYHQQAFHHHLAQPTHPPPPPTYIQNPPYDHRQRATTLPARPQPPPLPPKPILYPSIAPPANRDEFPTHFTPPLPTAHPILSQPNPPYIAPPLPPGPPIPHQPSEQPSESPVEDSNELAMALALSQSESVQRKKLDEQLLQKEEEDLAKALAESMLSTGSNLQSSSNPFFSPNALASDDSIRSIPLHVPADILPSQSLPPTFGIPQEAAHTTQTTSTNTAFSEFGRYDKWRIPGVSQHPQAEEAPSELKRENSAPKRPSFSSSSADHVPVGKAHRSPAARPLSVSSASSLPYTQPSPVSNAFGAIDSLPVYAHDGSDFAPRSAMHPVDSAPQESASAEPDSETVLVFDDEAYARQLAAEEEEWARQQLEQFPSASDEKRRLDNIQDEPSEGRGLPVYSKQPEWQSLDQPSPSQDFHPVQESPNLAGPSSYRPIPHYPQTKQQKFESHPTTSVSEPSSSVPFSLVVYPSLGKRRESESDTRSEASHHSSTRSTASAPTGHSDRPHPSQPKRGEDDRRPSFSDYPPPEENMSDHAQHHPQFPPDEMTSGKTHRLPPGVLNPNHFLDHKLLLGVAIGFTPPHISPELVPMQDSVPNLITLPYSRCPPLYVQAPDWRHLLRLMARLSTSRIEATVQAMAISKTDLKLRTVVQFLKPHPASKDWRTMVWFTIDHPVPPSVPEAHRYLSGNPNLLPWSYSLGSLPTLMRDNPDPNFQKHQTPMLLHDGKDTLVSKIYTIPASEALPLPTLPITFPNLALYLQAALDYSRRHSSDGLNLGKLGKLVQTCYPSVEQISEFDIPERSSVGHLFKRVMGRSNKDRKKGKATNNEETYQLVTPFVPDEWG